MSLNTRYSLLFIIHTKYSHRELLYYLTKYCSQGVTRIILMVMSHGRHSSGWTYKEDRGK